jgi:hypothetical protein
MLIAKTVANAIAQRKLVVRKNSGWRTQYEPNATHGVNERRLARQIDFASEPSDVNVYEVGARIEMIVPDLLEQHGPSDNLAMVPDQVLEQPQLSRLQVEPARSATRFPRQKIDFQIAHSQKRGPWLGRAAQQRIHTCAELSEGKGLGQIVVAAGAQAAHPLFHFPKRTQQ